MAQRALSSGADVTQISVSLLLVVTARWTCKFVSRAHVISIDYGLDLLVLSSQLTQTRPAGNVRHVQLNLTTYTVIPLARCVTEAYSYVECTT